jgi:hypothetical protein
VTVLRRAALEGLARAVKRGRVVVAADPAVLERARRARKLAIDARLVAEAVRITDPDLSGDARER